MSKIPVILLVELVDVASAHPEIVKAMWNVVKESHREPENDEPLFRMEIPYPIDLD